MSTRGVLIACFALCSTLAALAGVLLAGYSTKAYQAMGDAYLLPAIAAVVLGGTNILGGRGNYIGTIAGVILITDGYHAPAALLSAASQLKDDGVRLTTICIDATSTTDLSRPPRTNDSIGIEKTSTIMGSVWLPTLFHLEFDLKLSLGISGK